MSFVLKILSAPDPSLKGTKIALVEGENLVGRIKPPAQVQLDCAKVSKKHCVITVAGEALKVGDLNSSNGIYVNGKKVSSATLKPKDRLVIGEFILEVAVK
jgi:pSer/pThr/pTyr-binding forkhead associated (FHA) protein